VAYSFQRSWWLFGHLLTVRRPHMRRQIQFASVAALMTRFVAITPTCNNAARPLRVDWVTVYQILLHHARMTAGLKSCNRTAYTFGRGSCSERR
jgi:hypothetical protein